MKKTLLVLTAVAMLVACGETTKTQTDDPRGSSVDVRVEVNVNSGGGNTTTPPLPTNGGGAGTQCDDAHWGATITFSMRIDLAWGMTDCDVLMPHPRTRGQALHQNPGDPSQVWEVDETLQPGMTIGLPAGSSGVHFWPTAPNVFGDGKGWFQGSSNERRWWCETELLDYVESIWNSTEGEAALPYFNGNTCSVSHDGQHS